MRMNTGIKHKGEFRVVARKAHTIDMQGNIIEGEISDQSGKGRNVITLNGFDQMLTNVPSGFSIAMVAGTGTTAPTETDTVLTTYKGYTTGFVSSTITKNNVPDVDGYVTFKITYKFTFNPGSLGTGMMNIAEAGVVKSGTINNTTPLIAHGRLVDGVGAPTTVSYDATNEYLDMYWEYTCYVPAEVTGNVTIVIDGVNTNFAYVVRPMLFTSYWISAGGNFMPGWRFSNTTDNSAFQFSTNCATGPISTLDSSPTGNGGTANFPSIAYSTYVTGSKQRDVILSWVPSKGNLSGGIGAIGLGGADGGGSRQCFLFQIGYTPALPKTSDYFMSLTYTFTMGNK